MDGPEITNSRYIYIYWMYDITVVDNIKADPASTAHKTELVTQ